MNLNAEQSPYLPRQPMVILPDGTQQLPLGSGVIVSLLGEGGAAIVYEIWNEKLGVKRAVKILRPNALAESLQRFENEMRITAQLCHPNIIEIHNVGEYHGLPYIEMERLEGMSLDDLIKKHGALPLPVCLAIGIMTCRALTYTHNHDYKLGDTNYKGILHRDLKPANIMIGKAGTVKLMDFGIATPTNASMFTTEGTVVGSLHYLAPEQLTGARATAVSDIYAFGAVMYEMLTGHRVFKEQNMALLMSIRLKNEFRPLNSFSIKIPYRMIKIVSACLAVEQAKRPQSASAILVQLEKMMAQYSTWVRYDTTIDRTDLPVIDVTEPDQDTSVTGSRSMTLRGVIRNNLVYDSLDLSIRINDSLYTSVSGISVGNPTWQQDIYLPADSNSVLLVLINPVRTVPDTLTVLRALVLYDSTLTDTRGPTVASVSVNSFILTGAYFMPGDTARLEIIAYDQSGVKSVTANGRSASNVGGDRFAVAVPLVHQEEGNQIVIGATDIYDNQTLRLVTIFSNRLPVIYRVPPFRYVTAGEAYCDTVGATDADNDTIYYSARIRSVQGETLVVGNSGGAFCWVPSLADTVGLTEIIVHAYDGYQTVTGTYSVAVKPPAAQEVMAHFLVTGQSFPAAIEAVNGLLSIVLSIDKPPGAGTFVFNALLASSGRYIKLNSSDSLLTWTPQLADTGTQTLVITVTSGPGLVDTVMPVITVTPPPPPVFVAFSASASTCGEAQSPCSIAVALNRPLPSAVTVDFQVYPQGTSAGAGDYTLPNSRTLLFPPGEQVQYLVFDITGDSIPESDETVALSLVNPSGGPLLGTGSVHTVTITDDDEPVIVYTASIITPDASGPEVSTVVPVSVRISPAPQSEMRLSLKTAGTAQYGLDYTVDTLDLMFAPAESIKTVRVTIIDDVVCEQGDESVVLAVGNRDFGLMLGDSVFQYVIGASDPENCNLSLVLVYGGWGLDAQERAIVDSLTAAGYTVAAVSRQNVDNALPAGTDAVILSNTITDYYPGAVYRTRNIPVLAVSTVAARSLRLFKTLASDTGHYLGTSLDVLQPQSGNDTYSAVRISESYCRIPWGNCAESARIHAKVHRTKAGGSYPDLPAVVTYMAGDALSDGTSAPNRRSVFPVCKASRTIIYRQEWWNMLKNVVYWTVLGEGL